MVLSKEFTLLVSEYRLVTKTKVGHLTKSAQSVQKHLNPGLKEKMQSSNLVCQWYDGENRKTTWMTATSAS